VTSGLESLRRGKVTKEVQGARRLGREERWGLWELGADGVRYELP
jgi:hypothetical protein